MRRRLPADRRPPLEPGERVVAWSGAVVATTHGLFLPGRSRLGWHEINKATWAEGVLTIVPSSVVSEHDGYDVVADQPAVSVPLPDPGDVPDQVRTRVTRSVVFSAHHPHPGLRVVARRVSGVDGLRWAVRYDPGVDADDARADALVAEERETV